MPIPARRWAPPRRVDRLEFVRMIAVARLVCPRSMVRIAAGREHMSRELQALCFLAGANSIFVGARLLTTNNPGRTADAALLAELKMKPMSSLP
jgi:biotin synthase